MYTPRSDGKYENCFYEGTCRTRRTRDEKNVLDIAIDAQWRITWTRGEDDESRQKDGDKRKSDYEMQIERTEWQHIERTKN